MKTFLRWAALVLFLSTLTVWAWRGAHLSWTKTSVQVQKVDPVLEMEYTEWEERFVPGVDFLAGGVIAAGVLFGVSALLRPKKLR